jgi:hypothetical protein
VRGRFTRAVVAVSALLYPAVAAGAANAQQPSPQRLVAALVATPVAVSKLPTGFASPRVTRVSPDAAARRHHAIALVEVEFTRGNAIVFFMVFPRHADAAASWQDALQLPANNGLERTPVPGLPKPGLILSGKEQGVGYSAVIFVRDNVAVAAAPPGVRGAASGDRRATLALARFALDRLAAAERRAAR